MRQPVLADKLQPTTGVFLVHAGNPRGYGQTEAGGMVVAHLDPDSHRHPMAAITGLGPETGPLSLEQVLLAAGNARGLQQGHLLLLVVVDGGRSGQGVEVVLEQGLLPHLGRGRGFQCLPQNGAAQAVLLLDPVHVTGHQLQVGIRIADAALVGQGHPAVQVQAAVVIVQFSHVVGPPGEAAGQVGDLHLLLPGALVIHRHGQGGAVTQVGRHVRVDQPAADLGLDAVAGLQHHAVTGAEHPYLPGLFLAGGRMPVDERHLPAHVLAQQGLGAEQVVFEILLMDPQTVGPDEHGFRPDAGAHLAEGEGVRPRAQVDGAAVLDQGQVMVVDGDADRLAVAGRDDAFLRGQGRAGNERADKHEGKGRAHEVLRGRGQGRRRVEQGCGLLRGGYSKKGGATDGDELVEAALLIARQEAELQPQPADAQTAEHARRSHAGLGNEADGQSRQVQAAVGKKDVDLVSRPLLRIEHRTPERQARDADIVDGAGTPAVKGHRPPPDRTARVTAAFTAARRARHGPGGGKGVFSGHAEWE